MNDKSPSAFPCSNSYMTGMSLRDWFAGMALQGAWANPDLSTTMSDNRMTPEEVRESLALSAYRQADIMIAQRDK